VRRKQNKKLSLDVAAYSRQMILARGRAEHHPTLSILPSLRRRAVLLYSFHSTNMATYVQRIAINVAGLQVEAVILSFRYEDKLVPLCQTMRSTAVQKHRSDTFRYFSHDVIFDRSSLRADAHNTVMRNICSQVEGVNRSRPEYQVMIV
jgi:hypothetical protein